MPAWRRPSPPNPTPATYDAGGRDPIEVWVVQATVRSNPVELQLARVGAHAVYIDDRTPDGSAFLLSDLEYESVAAQLDDPTRVARIRRNIAITVAAVLVVAVALGHAVLALRPRSTA